MSERAVFPLDPPRDLGTGPRNGTWRPIPGGDHVAGALVGCPKCGFSVTVWDFQIAPSGRVFSSVHCPGCCEALRATLEGWEENSYALPAAESAPEAASSPETAEECLTSPRQWAAFLRAGGVLGWQDWRDLGPEERAALEQAGGAVEAERAQLVADAILERLGGAGDELEAEAAIEAGLAAAERHSKKPRPPAGASGP